MMRRAAIGIGCVIVAAVALTFGARAVARAFLFPSRDVARRATPDGFVVHSLVARDGVAVHALELPAPEGARTVVDFHNNRETVEERAGVARALHERGFGVLLVEYRGYGASRGTASCEDGLYADAEAALDMLAARGIGAERIVLWGTSLGTGVAAEMARRGRGARLVLVSPYTSIPDLVTNVAPFVPARALVADHFDTLSKARDIRVPTLVIHGDADEIVPFAMGETLSRAIGGARLLRVAGGHHGDLFARQGDDLFAEIAAHGKI
jgi:fermentation-respiration switch protein FrsA (DUF1100 family)